jgi:hypothetical protein
LTPPLRFTFSKKNYGKVNPVVPLFIIVSILAAYYAVFHSGLLSGVVDSEVESGRIEVVDVSCSQDEYENWVVTVSVRGLDEVPFRLSKILVKGMEVSRYHADPPSSKVSTLTSAVNTGTVVLSGEESEMVIWVGRDFGLLQPTQRVSIRIEDAAGVVYPASVVLSGAL